MNRPHTIDHHEEQLHTTPNLMDRIRKYLQVGAVAVALTAPVSVNSHIPPSDSPFKSENTETTEVVEDMNTFTPTHDPVHDVAVLRRQHPEYKGRR